MATSSEATAATARWKGRRNTMESRAYAAHQRDAAALGREDAAQVRELGARIRAEAALVRDAGARIRDDAARVRDQASLVRDGATRSRDEANRTREDATRLRLAKAPLDREAWKQLFELDQLAAERSREASRRDRDAAELDRVAAEKDRQAAEQDRIAASRDRDAADRDREAAEKDRAAADADRAAADADRSETEGDLSVADDHLSRTDRIAAMGSLAAGLAHELNNPLTTLLSTLALLEQEASAGGRALVADATLAAERIAHVVADMRAWLHGSSGRAARRQVDLRQLVDEAVRLSGATLRKKARIVVELQPTPPVWGVPGRLGQVLTNLVLNASHAMSDAPDVNTLHVTSRAVDGFVELAVHDTGCGITADVLPHIFDPFFTTREGTGGSGLGLAMCERIVSEHGGSIVVASEPGKGSTFTVRLPLGDAEHQAPPELMPPAPHLARVLLIDDDAAIARSVSRLLAKQCEVTVAENGKVGLERLLAPGVRWDLVLCDLMMPVMNGLELYKALRVQAPTLAGELVFITGGATTPETTEFLAGLPNVLLQKPFDLKKLLHLIETRAQPR